MRKLSICLISILYLSTAYPSTLSDTQILDWIRTWAEKMPKPLAKGDSISNWWPLKDGVIHTYCVTESKWDFGKKFIGRKFSLRMVRDKKIGNRYSFEVKGFDEFPYSAIKVVDNRVFLIHKELPKHQLPFLVFPLFDGIMYADKDYEYELLKNCIFFSTEKGFYAPVRNEFIRVSKVEGNIYYLERMDAGPGAGELAVFEKGSGIIEWVIEGGIKIKRVSK